MSSSARTSTTWRRRLTTTSPWRSAGSWGQRPISSTTTSPSPTPSQADLIVLLIHTLPPLLRPKQTLPIQTSQHSNPLTAPKRRKNIPQISELGQRSSSMLWVLSMETPLLRFWNTLRSLSISSSMESMSSSSGRFSSALHMLLLSRIFRYSSGLLSMMQLFSISPLKGLISIVSPKDLSDRKSILPAISVLVTTGSFSPARSSPRDPSARTPSPRGDSLGTSLMRVRECRDFLDGSWGSSGSWSFFLGSWTMALRCSSSFLSSILILRLTRGRRWGWLRRKKGWEKMFLLGSLRDLWKPYMLSWRMKLLMLRWRKNLGRMCSWNSSISLMANSRPLAIQWIIDSYSLFSRIQKLFWMKLATEHSPYPPTDIYSQFLQFKRPNTIYHTLPTPANAHQYQLQADSISPCSQITQQRSQGD